MKVYFTASTTADGKFQNQYREIIVLVKKLGHQILSGEQIISEKLLSKDKTLTPEEIFRREKKAIEGADCVVAEVSSPSHGVGSEIAYALTKEKHVLALFYQETKDLLSPMVAGNPSTNLYLEHYNDDNLQLVLRHFFEHVFVHQKKKGKLIVIDGGDGSGKATQTKLLIDYLKTKKIHVKTFDFPRYYSSFHGKMVGRYLTGEFGDVKEVSPYLTSLAYAVDRAGAKEEMDEWLKKGGLIITNRYTTTSMAYMSAKLEKGQKREEFIEWLDELEYRTHRVPREDLVIYLDLPPFIGQKLVEQKAGRGYMNGQKKDIHERNLEYLEEVEKVYLDLIKEKKNWVVVNCVKNGEIKTKEEIHQEILQVLKEKKII